MVRMDLNFAWLPTIANSFNGSKRFENQNFSLPVFVRITQSSSLKLVCNQISGSKVFTQPLQFKLDVFFVKSAVVTLKIKSDMISFQLVTDLALEHQRYFGVQ